MKVGLFFGTFNPIHVGHLIIANHLAEYSDLDLHLVVQVPDTVEYKELLDAKKNVYNARHDIKVKGIDVELYAQDVDQEHHSLGIYSVLKNTWVSRPERRDVEIDSRF